MIECAQLKPGLQARFNRKTRKGLVIDYRGDTIKFREVKLNYFNNAYYFNYGLGGLRTYLIPANTQWPCLYEDYVYSNEDFERMLRFGNIRAKKKTRKSRRKKRRKRE